jgi:nicotinate-nucleotide adenylyltransferase
MRLGILGGSFDPVHYGHLALARACQLQASLDEVWFVPTAVQPLKRQGPQASNAQRVEMLRLATSNEPTWRICTLEIDRGGASYTVDTLRQMREELPDAELFFLIGSDALRDVERWKEPREIFRLATPLVVHRAGEPTPGLSLLASLCAAGKQPQLIEMPPHPASSTEIRRRVAAHEDLDGLVPSAVANYILNENLYAVREVNR